jgi:ABC-2 type transport system ATP-binding protein
MRETILKLKARGKTVFLSSHNLDEVQRICDRVAFINHGEIRLQGALEELRGDNNRRQLEIRLKADIGQEKSDTIGADLQKLPFISAWRYERDHFILGVKGEAELDKIIGVLAQYAIQAEEIRKEQASLEEIYTRAMQEAGQ